MRLRAHLRMCPDVVGPDVSYLTSIVFSLPFILFFFFFFFFKSIILTDTYPCRNLILFFFLRHLSTRRYSICPMQMCYSFFFFFL